MSLPKALTATSEQGGRWVASCGQGPPTHIKLKPSLIETVGRPVRVSSSNAYDYTSPRGGFFGLFYRCFGRNRPTHVKNRPPMTIHFVRMMTLCENVRLRTTGTHTLQAGSSNPTQHLLIINVSWGRSYKLVCLFLTSFHSTGQKHL